MSEQAPQTNLEAQAERYGTHAQAINELGRVLTQAALGQGETPLLREHHGERWDTTKVGDFSSTITEAKVSNEINGRPSTATLELSGKPGDSHEVHVNTLTKEATEIRRKDGKQVYSRTPTPRRMAAASRIATHKFGINGSAENKAA